ncbi:hypothetical protein [Methylocystis parvus]|uniref:hypothetical protein n=1 Tax=Methylocystis parvus TaxID=134 RepID=UPI003C75BABA
MSHPITSLEAFVRAHMSANDAISLYLEANKANYQPLDMETQQQLDRRSAVFMHANNAYSRIALVKTVLEQTADLLDPATQQSPIFMVSVAPAHFAVELEAANGFDVERVRRWTKRALESRDALSIVEAALYTNANVAGHPARMVSWHSHSPVWNRTRKQLDAQLKPLRNRHTSFVPGIEAVHVADVSASAVEKAIYICKAPLKEYRLIRRESVNQETGEVIQRFDQKKRDMRTGDRVRMCKVMSDHYLNNLLFGTGKEVLFAAELPTTF